MAGLLILGICSAELDTYTILNNILTDNDRIRVMDVDGYAVLDTIYSTTAIFDLSYDETNNALKVDIVALGVPSTYEAGNSIETIMNNVFQPATSTIRIADAAGRVIAPNFYPQIDILNFVYDAANECLLVDVAPAGALVPNLYSEIDIWNIIFDAP